MSGKQKNCIAPRIFPARFINIVYFDLGHGEDYDH